MKRYRTGLFVSGLLLVVLGSLDAYANGLTSCQDLESFQAEPVITIDFEGFTEITGNAGAYELLGDEYASVGLVFTAANGADGLWVGIPDTTLGLDNCINFYANDFVAVSPVAVLSPDNCNLPGSPVGAVIVNFDDPVSALGLSFLDPEGAVSSITAYDGVDGTGNVLGTATATGFPSDSQVFKYVLNADQAILSAVIQLGGGGDGVGMDDLCFIDPDSDDDGIINVDDLCPNTPTTDPNVPLERLGKNRWIWEGSDWMTNAKGVEKDFTIEETQGCSCEQILDELVNITDLEFDGHYKFGCSQSVVEDWILGLYHMETVDVPAVNDTPVESLTVLKSTENYQLVASGIADAGDSILFDAKYSVSTSRGEDPGVLTDWTDAVTGYEQYGPTLLDLFVNGASVNWGPFDPSHTYMYPMVGLDAPVSLIIYDIYPINNLGKLSVDIFVELW